MIENAQLKRPITKMIWIISWENGSAFIIIIIFIVIHPKCCGCLEEHQYFSLFSRMVSTLIYLYKLLFTSTFFFFLFNPTLVNIGRKQTIGSFNHSHHTSRIIQGTPLSYFLSIQLFKREEKIIKNAPKLLTYHRMWNTLSINRLKNIHFQFLCDNKRIVIKKCCDRDKKNWRKIY